MVSSRTLVPFSQGLSQSGRRTSDSRNSALLFPVCVLTVSCLATIVFVQTTFFSLPFFIAAETCNLPLLALCLTSPLLGAGRCTLLLLLCSIL